MTDTTTAAATTPRPDNRGERNGMAKLTEDDVHAIRAMRAEGKTQAQIAASFGVTQVTVSAILAGTRWAHVPLRA